MELTPQDIWNATEKHQQNIQKLRTSLWLDLFKRETKASDPVYHYTDSNGLAGILNSGKLWMTEASHLNDPDEINFGANQINAALQRINIHRRKSTPDFPG
ncbi:MAG TPA: hypothetical protein VMH92_04435, partial [Acidocella sp.]|nr:hypothetical protein [Acidocella sp.]